MPEQATKLKVEVWSDVVCPWCFLGKRRLETALERFEDPGAVEVEWRSFQLQPDAPRFGEPGAGAPTEEYLRARGLPPAQIEEMQARLTGLAAEEGLAYRLDLAHHVNTFAAHTLVKAADRLGLGAALVERLFMAQQVEGLRIDDPEVLTRLAAEVGLEGAAAVPDEGDARAVREDLAIAGQLQISGVPFFLFDHRLAVSGAQSSELLLEALRRAGAEAPA
jgi:predicted DsbA family dithiol-disulfide isomerase